jgi:hypothetical protein
LGKELYQGIIEITNNINSALQNFYENAFNFIGFALFLFGLVHVIIKKNKLLSYVFVLSFLSMMVIIFKAGDTFARHSYYIVPFVPVMALIAGYGLAQIKNKKIAFVVLLAISIDGILSQQHDFRIHDKEWAILNLEEDLDKVSLLEDLILINSGEYPTPMYFAHRKGWVESNEKLVDEKYINNLKEKGLKYIVILKKAFGTNIDLDLPIVLDNNDYCIYQ